MLDLAVRCPQCGRSLRIPGPEVFGQRVKCKECRSTFVAHAPEDSNSPPRVSEEAPATIGHESHSPDVPSVNQSEVATFVLSAASSVSDVPKPPGVPEDLVDLAQYHLVAKLGQGGMGAVYKAEHQRLKKLVAVKVLPPECSRDPAYLARFEREMQAVGKLDHPNIVRALDADTDRGVHYLVMEFVSGKDLMGVLREKGPLPIDRACDYIVQAAKGLDYAHKHGVIHRDIKPGNLFLSDEGVVKVLDLGLARVDDASQVSDLTNAGAVMGTADFMSPEQALDTRHADARSDVYSLGCTLFFLITGKLLFDGDTVMKKLVAHRERPIPKLRAARPDAPARLEDILLKMLAKKPENRVQSMADVIELLTPLTDPGGLVDPPPAKPAPAPNPAPAPPRPPAPTSGIHAAPRPPAPHAPKSSPKIAPPPPVWDEPLPEPLPSHSRRAHRAKHKASRPQPIWFIAGGAAALLVIVGVVWIVVSQNTAPERTPDAPAKPGTPAPVAATPSSANPASAPSSTSPAATSPPGVAAPANAHKGKPGPDRLAAERLVAHHLAAVRFVRPAGVVFREAARFPKDDLELEAILGTDQLRDEDAQILVDYVKQLSSLKEIVLGVNCGDRWIVQAGELPALSVLNAAGSKVTDGGLGWLPPQSEITQLNLSRTAVSDAGIAGLPALKKLAVCDVSQTQVTAAKLAELTRWPALAVLHFTARAGDAAPLEQFAKLPALRELHVDGSAAWLEPEFQALGKLSTLESLSLREPHEQQIPWIAKLTRLRGLSLTLGVLKPAALADLKSLTRLQRFALLGQVEPLHVASLPDWADLESLELGGRLSPVALQPLTKFPKLNSLTISGASDLTVESVQQVLPRCRVQIVPPLAGAATQ